MISHFKALIFSSLELQGQRARPPNKASTPIWMKMVEFHSRGRGGFVWMPSPLSLELQGTEYQGFKMRYNTLFLLKWFSKYDLSKLNDERTSLLVLKRTFFSIIQIWRLVFFKPLRVQRHTVPHFKAINQCQSGPRSSRVWHHFYPLPRPVDILLLEMAKGAAICRLTVHSAR